MAFGESIEPRLREVELALMKHVTECAGANAAAERRLAAVEVAVERAGQRVLYLGVAVLIMMALSATLGPAELRTLLQQLVRVVL